MGWAERANRNRVWNKPKEQKNKKGVSMTEEIVATGKRAGRIGVDVAVAGVVAEITGNPLWLGLAPLLAAIGKFLRAVFKLNFVFF